MKLQFSKLPILRIHKGSSKTKVYFSRGKKPPMNQGQMIFLTFNEIFVLKSNGHTGQAAVHFTRLAHIQFNDIKA